LPYIAHIGAVLVELFPALRENPALDAENAICCAILHDTVEDTETSLAEIEERFGSRVASGVSALTKNTALSGIAAMRDSLDRIGKEPREVRIVKLADRIANLRVPPVHWSREKQLAYAEEGEVILGALGDASPLLASVLSARIAVWKHG
jgi:(p)ppGpp synthase/HD superfamily hydrolase